MSIIDDIVNNIPKQDTLDGLQNIEAVEEKIKTQENTSTEKIEKHQTIDSKFGKLPIKEVPLNMRHPKLVYDDQGNLQFKRDGKTPKQKRGVSSATEFENPFEKEAKIEQYRQFGAMYANMFFGLCQQMGGEDFKPNQIEKEQIEINVTNVLQEKGISDLSPTWALTFSLGCYLVTREKFRDSIRKAKSIVIKKSIFESIKDKFKFKKKEKSNASETHINNGNDGDRKIEPSEIIEPATTGEGTPNLSI